MILVTGGTGYIGSHTCIEFIEAGYELIVLDNFSNSSPEVLNRIQHISGKRPELIEGDTRNKQLLEKLFETYPIDAVIHFAGLKAVGESVTQPLKYFDNNVNGTITLLGVMAKYHCKKIVFSSSATVYGKPETVPVREDFPLSATNPYGRTKLMIEQILKDLYQSDHQWRIALLRYFNPIGAHPSGLIGEDPNGTPNNLMPFISQVAIGKREKLNVFGNDYETPDGTGIRDYIHVVDLAKGHLKALQAMDMHSLITVNLGTGQGYSVLELIHTFEKTTGRQVPYIIADRRPGDVAKCYADPALARQLLDWQAESGLAQMCADSWHWQSQNPDGYQT